MRPIVHAVGWHLMRNREKRQVALNTCEKRQKSQILWTVRTHGWMMSHPSQDPFSPNMQKMLYNCKCTQIHLWTTLGPNATLLETLLKCLDT